VSRDRLVSLSIAFSISEKTQDITLEVSRSTRLTRNMVSGDQQALNHILTDHPVLALAVISSDGTPGLYILACEVGYQRPCENCIISDSWRVVNDVGLGVPLRGNVFKQDSPGFGVWPCTAYQMEDLGNCRRLQGFGICRQLPTPHNGDSCTLLSLTHSKPFSSRT
jgi:hypothetical protein